MPPAKETPFFAGLGAMKRTLIRRMPSINGRNFWRRVTYASGGPLFSPVDNTLQSRGYPGEAVPVCLSQSVCGLDPILRRTALKLVVREFCK